MSIYLFIQFVIVIEMWDLYMIFSEWENGHNMVNGKKTIRWDNDEFVDQTIEFLFALWFIGVCSTRNTRNTRISQNFMLTISIWMFPWKFSVIK